MKLSSELCKENKNYLVSIKGNKRKSRSFYYSHVDFRGVVFTLEKYKAHRTYTKEEADNLVQYLEERIEEVGLVLYKSFKPYWRN